MNNYSEYYSVHLDVDGYPEGVEVIASSSYSGYSDEKTYYITAMDYAELSEITEQITTYDRMESDFNAMVRRFHANSAKLVSCREQNFF